MCLERTYSLLTLYYRKFLWWEQGKTSGFPYLRKNKEENGQYYALAIGFCVISGAYGVGVLSGGAFNPAVAFALDVTSALGPTSGVG